MSTEMVSLLVTAGVSVIGLAANTFVSLNSTRISQQLAAMTSRQSRQDRLREERRDFYLRFLGAIDAWNRSLHPGLVAARAYVAGGGAERLADLDPAVESFPAAARTLVLAFQDLDGAADGVRLASNPAVAQVVDRVCDHVQKATFAVLDGTVESSPYVPGDLVASCVRQMGTHLGYQDSGAS